MLRQAAILLPVGAAACYVGASVTRDPAFGLCGIAIGAAAVGWLSQIWILVYVRRRASGSPGRSSRHGAKCARCFWSTSGDPFHPGGHAAVPTSWPTLLQLLAAESHTL